MYLNLVSNNNNLIIKYCYFTDRKTNDYIEYNTAWYEEYQKAEAPKNVQKLLCM